MNENSNKANREQETDRSTSGGGLGQGREMAAGLPEDQLNEKGRAGKGMGGTSDTVPETTNENARSEIRPSKAGKAGRSGGTGIDLGDKNDPALDPPASGAEWSGQRGMGGSPRASGDQE